MGMNLYLLFTPKSRAKFFHYFMSGAGQRKGTDTEDEKDSKKDGRN
jgi:hypothetical protein